MTIYHKTTHMLLHRIHPSFDVVVRPVPNAKLDVVFISSIVDLTRVEDRLLKPLTHISIKRIPNLSVWLNDTLHLASIKRASTVDEALQALLDNSAVLCCSNEYFVVGVQGLTRRTPEEPATEVAIRGPRDGFTESIDTNISLLRTRMKNPDLTFDKFVIGERSKTTVLLTYIRDLANADLVQEATNRLRQVKIDGLLDAGILEQWIEDNHWSPYPQIQATERPDKVAAALLEGRLAFFVDGTPFVLLAPAVFISFFQTSDDYTQRWWSGTALRTIRLIALFVSIFIPSFYIALTMFNPELMPLNMTLQLAATREGIPLPIVMEAITMEVMVELVREAGNRMPQQMGQSYTIVGGLVIGDIAVQAGIVSPIMVVAVGLTALGAFAIPNYEAALVTRMIRFPMLIATSLFGIIGTLGFALIFLAHLSTLKSFGVPYLTPFGQLSLPDLKDTFARPPVQVTTLRPAAYLSPRSWLGRARYRAKKD
ncbi:spore germination protein [Alicyclobacillus mengziensis]|uniref:Spore germination protein n=1 Tax=Alicyclobacillus mengziensis TaxID=2931921 RepID=A0A9X7Z900_9BACL|nr:spore germination protein [Alicyclobacillus mengziensis]QSO48826.1 spore germination protein [Alicyclobacillus mengziensis]